MSNTNSNPQSQFTGTVKRVEFKYFGKTRTGYVDVDGRKMLGMNLMQVCDIINVQTGRYGEFEDAVNSPQAKVARNYPAITLIDPETNRKVVVIQPEAQHLFYMHRSLNGDVVSENLLTAAAATDMSRSALVAAGLEISEAEHDDNRVRTFNQLLIERMNQFTKLPLIDPKTSKERWFDGEFVKGFNEEQIEVAGKIAGFVNKFTRGVLEKRKGDEMTAKYFYKGAMVMFAQLYDRDILAFCDFLKEIDGHPELMDTFRYPSEIAAKKVGINKARYEKMKADVEKAKLNAKHKAATRG